MNKYNEIIAKELPLLSPDDVEKIMDIVRQANDDGYDLGYDTAREVFSNSSCSGKCGSSCGGKS